ncbi:uncharacterized protein [Epargyreus clarus]|uniref:uncharacterized protein n=1 Tax=Epargyreus clarus TaxID=520877 RepID=UPI003C2B1229
MSTAVLKLESESETCAVCGGGGELLTPEEHDAGAPPLQAPLRSMLLHINNNKVIPDGRLCTSCIRRAIEAYEFSTTLGAKGTPPLSEKIRALRQKLHELTQKIDVFIVVGGPGMNSGGSYSEDDIIMVERDALAMAAAADDEDLEKARNACGDTVYQCTVCPLTFHRASEYRAHQSAHPAGARHSCWTCGAQFAARAALRDHARQHDLPADLTCHLCNTVFQNASELRAHTASSGACGSSCPACGAACGGRAALARHVAAAHALLCPVCFVRMPSRAHLAAHALAHRQADRFVCGYDACILRFANRSDLMSHIRKLHSGEAAPREEPPPSAVPCPHCTRTFGSVAAMKRHVRVHRRDRQPSQDVAEWRMELEALAGGEAGDVEYLELEALDDLDDRA